ncbi:MAG: sulfite exporter TauE/SafE family protein [Chloroflexi bacterium]|nr:sulfite exporter TauE/SafE family protein [Chloroflexota bacterium]
MDLLQYLVFALLGSTLAGTLGAIVGLGGGIVVVPLLTIFLGIDIRYAIGASIVSVIATSSGAAAAYVREGITNRRVGLVLATATTTGAVTGTLAAAYISAQALYLIFAVILGYSAMAMFQKRHVDVPINAPDHPWARRLRLAGAYPDATLGKMVHYNVGCVPLALVLMYASGIVSGLLGIGSGSLNVPAMDMVLRLPLKVSTATSNFMIGVTAAASASLYFARGDIVPIVAAPVAIGVLIGAMAGARAMVRLRTPVIRQIFVFVLVVIALQMGAKGLNLRLI